MINKSKVILDCAKSYLENADRQTYSGWVAQMIQHEMDHLEGIII